MPRKAAPPKGRKPEPPKRTHPTPKRCPRCAARRVIELPMTPGGVFPWRCAKCRAIGYDDRIVGEPAVALERAKRGRPRRDELNRRFIRRPGRPVDPADVE